MHASKRYILPVGKSHLITAFARLQKHDLENISKI